MGRIHKPKPMAVKVADILIQLSAPVGLISYAYTLNVTTSLIVAGIVLALGLVILTVFHQQRQEHYLRSGLDLVDRMSGIEFEEFLLAHFRSLNYKAQTTPVTDDYGADLILEKDGIKTVVQAKRWGTKVGVEAVQQILGAMGYYKAQKGIVVTNNYCSQNAHILADANDIKIWNRDALQEIMIKNNSKIHAENVKSKEIADANICPLCAAPLVAKKGRYGSFWGCSAYPKCFHTQKTI